MINMDVIDKKLNFYRNMANLFIVHGNINFIFKKK
jgi:hypothetical protein